MRTYSFDHYLADKPEPSTTNPGGARQTPPAEEAKPQVPPSEEGHIHYGRQHAQTAELYRKHREEREERERAEQMRAAESEAQPSNEETPPVEAREQEAAPREEQEVPKPDEFGREELKQLAQQAVTSVLQAAREAARGRPLVGAKQLAGDAVAGAFRVVREVSARTSRASRNEQTGGNKKKEPGKKR